jgi:hypothetical protein
MPLSVPVPLAFGKRKGFSSFETDLRSVIAGTYVAGA